MPINSKKEYISYSKVWLDQLMEQALSINGFAAGCSKYLKWVCTKYDMVDSFED